MKYKFKIALLVFLLSLPGYGTIHYVKAGNTTPAFPYTTWATASDSIQKVVNICLSGDTILIGTGVYTELVVSNSVGRYLTVIGIDVDSCIIDISAYSSGIPPFPIYTTAFSAMDHLTMRSLTFKTNFGDNEHSGVILEDNFDSVTSCFISNLKFIGNFQNAIAIGKSTGIIEDCYFYRCYRGVKIDFGHSSEPVTIQNNLFQRCHNGIHSDYAVIRNNWVLEVMNTGMNLGSLFYTTRAYVYNNLISALAEAGYIGIRGNHLGEVINNVITGFNYGMEPKSNCTVKNNVIMNSKLAAVGISAWPTLNGDINYNLFYNNKMITANSSSFDPDTTIYYTSDPMFENPDSNNYFLQMFSSLINAGDPNILDLDGTRSDVGLYGGPYGQNYIYKDLPPKRPKFTLVSKQNGKVKFNWRGGTEADFNSFSLHRSRDPLFVPNENNRIFTGRDTLLTDSLADPTGSYSYKLNAKDNQGNVSKLDSVTVVITGIDDEEAATPERIYLYQNYPNPFNPSTKIKFSLTDESEVILRVYDVNGALLTILQNGWLQAGEYEREFSPKTIGTLKDIASGVYFYNLLVRDKDQKPLFVKTEKMMFLK